MSSWIFTSLVIYYDKSSSAKLLDLSQTRFVYSAWNLWAYPKQNCIASHVSSFLLWYISTLLKILKAMYVVSQFHELGSILAYFCLLICLQNKFKILNSYFASVCVFHIPLSQMLLLWAKYLPWLIFLFHLLQSRILWNLKPYHPLYFNIETDCEKFHFYNVVLYEVYLFTMSALLTYVYVVLNNIS